MSVVTIHIRVGVKNETYQLPYTGAQLSAYLKKIHALGLALHSRRLSSGHSAPVRLSYIPRAGDVVVICPPLTRRSNVQTLLGRVMGKITKSLEKGESPDPEKILGEMK